MNKADSEDNLIRDLTLNNIEPQPEYFEAGFDTSREFRSHFEYKKVISEEVLQKYDILQRTRTLEDADILSEIDAEDELNLHPNSMQVTPQN